MLTTGQSSYTSICRTPAGLTTLSSNLLASDEQIKGQRARAFSSVSMLNH